MTERFLVVSYWSDGDKVYRVADTFGGTRNRNEAARFPSREAAEAVAKRLRGGLPEMIGHTIEVEPESQDGTTDA